MTKNAGVTNQLLAMAIACMLLLAAPWILDELLGSWFAVATIAWLNIGLFVLKTRQTKVPVPDRHRIDVRGALRTLWWALFWPRYLKDRSRR